MAEDRAQEAPLGQATEPPRNRDRVVGRIDGDRPGPTLVVVGGMHGNEPAGVAAARKVLDALAHRGPRLRGSFTALVGNIEALSRGVRFVDRDLNRLWTAEPVGRARSGANGDVELAELRGLLTALDEALAGASGPAYVLDLHTTSGDSPPFGLLGDTLRNRAFAKHFAAPMILGLEERIDGTLIEYVGWHGIVGLGIETGRHEALEAVDLAEAVLWIALVAAGNLDEADVPELGDARGRLAGAARGLPGFVEIYHRHAITAADGFRMAPGFAGFQTVTRGQRLGEDRAGPVLAESDGLLLMPLYQGMGDDAYFLAREIRPLWLAASRRLRRLLTERLLCRLPGVSAPEDRPDTLVVDARVARWLPHEVFHVLGFRRRHLDGRALVVSRRSFDVAPPAG